MSSKPPPGEGSAAFRRGSFRQAIPRPAGAKPLVPVRAAFARLGKVERLRLARIEQVEAAFSEGGAPARDDVAAAVLVPLFERDGAANAVMIRRAVHLRANPGDVAFPGGRLEPGETAAEAAVREAFEEIALQPGEVRVLGELPPVSRASRTGRIGVIVAVVGAEAVLVANPHEVDECLLVPLGELASPWSYWEELWPAPDGTDYVMPFFELGEDVIWGATARIVVSLLGRLAGGK